MSPPTLRSDVSIRIALAFLEFLSTVQSSNGVDKTKIDNLKEMLMDVFKVKKSSMEATSPVSLYNLFDLDSKETTQKNESTSDAPNIAHRTHSHSTGSESKIGGPLINLFHEFHVAVAAIGFFDSSVGEDYQKRKSRAKQIFKDAIEILKTCGHETFDKMNLADGLKMLGNNAMHLNCYDKAIVMYSCALAMCKDNAIYLCNRAAAFTKIGKLNEAIHDCGEAIKINPRHAMAFYRLGYAYYEQGNNLEAIREGFIKVLQLEPHNNDAKVSLQLADSKLKDELEQMREQIERLMGNGSVAQADTRPSRVLVIKGPKEGGDGRFSVVEETGETSGGDDGDTINLAEFIETQVHSTPPPE